MTDGPDTERASRMGTSVARAARATGLTAADVDLVSRAHALAMEPRILALSDDHHPAYLHPGRTALVLLRDVGPVSATVLAAAAVHETYDEALRLDIERVRASLGDAVADLVEALPLPPDERLLERLVISGEDVRLAALAERLDQVRHLHVRPDTRPHWAALHAEVAEVWVTVAERTDDRLATRFRHWHRAFAKRVR